MEPRLGIRAGFLLDIKRGEGASSCGLCRSESERCSYSPSNSADASVWKVRPACSEW